MSDFPTNPETAAADSAAAGPPLSAEAEQAEALNVVDGEAVPEAPAGEVESAEEVLEEAPPAADETDYKDLYLRSAAEMDNLRKRARRDVGAAEGRGIAKLAKELLPAIDNLERALQAAEAAEGSGEHDITKGIRLVQAEFLGALARGGIQVEDPTGQPFDPHRHEALAQAPVEGVEKGLVAQTYQPGYVLGDTVIRAARVVVSS